jgi:hypothetical protein
LYDINKIITTFIFILIMTAVSIGLSALKGRDSNPGTESAPFLTIRKAVDICGPGDIIYVMEGIYTSAEYASVADFYNKHGTEDQLMILTPMNIVHKILLRRYI